MIYNMTALFVHLLQSIAGVESTTMSSMPVDSKSGCIRRIWHTSTYKPDLLIKRAIFARLKYIDHAGCKMIINMETRFLLK